MPSRLTIAFRQVYLATQIDRQTGRSVAILPHSVSAPFTTEGFALSETLGYTA